MKVAIVGLSKSHDLAPFEDDEWVKWGLAWDGHWARFDRLFEMHSDKWYMTNEYKSLLNERSECVPIVTQENYPLDEVIVMCGDYFASSIAYMIALAIYEGAEEIALFGIDMTDEYQFQRENAEYFIGFARGRGVKVRILPSSPLCKYKHQDYPERYGYVN